MSILGDYADIGFQEAILSAAPVLEEMMDGAAMSARQRSAYELLKEGLSPADILGISKREREAILAHGCSLVQAGDFEAAQEWLLFLTMLEPLDSRSAYALGVVYQAQGQFEVAGKTYLHCLALDATNAEGYLRLGECLAATGEKERAVACFKWARSECARGNGTHDAARYAEQKLAQLGGDRTTRSGPGSLERKSSC